MIYLNRGVIIMDLAKIKTLREETGQGMLEVKKALHEANEDLDKARDILNRLIKKDAPTQRVASKGLTNVFTEGDEAILFEVNAETDFVAKHKEFIKLMDDLAQVLIKSKAITVKDALQVKLGDITVEEHIKKVGNLIKENTFLRRFHRIKKQPSHHFVTYKHLGGKLSVLLIINQVNDTLGKDIALQIASHAPKYMSYEQIDRQTIDYEKMMLEQSGEKTDEISLKKYLESVSLYNQSFIKNPDLKVKDVLNDVKVIDFYRFELGQGIENKLNCRLDVPCDGSTITVTPIF